MLGRDQQRKDTLDILIRRSPEGAERDIDMMQARNIPSLTS